jgi:hypothetical protein
MRESILEDIILGGQQHVHRSATHRHHISLARAQRFTGWHQLLGVSLDYFRRLAAAGEQHTQHLEDCTA